MSSLRVAMLGTPAFAVPTLKALLASSHHVVGVITQPDRPRGRGQHVSSGPVKALAIEHRLQILQPERLRRERFEGDFDALQADLAVVAAYGKLLPAWLLAKPRLGFVNVHASLLPKYRGASPVHHAVMAGDEETGVTIMRVIEALDAGPMLAQRRVPIGPDATTAEIEAALATFGAAILVQTVDRIAQGPVAERAQNDAEASYAPRLTKAAGMVDWSRPASAVHNQVRGLIPWPLAYTFLGGSRLILRRSRLANELPAPSDGHESRVPSPVAPGAGGSGLAAIRQAGTIARLAGGGPAVACGDGRLLELVELQPEGRRAMSGHDALVGRVLVPGQQFDRVGSQLDRP
ncbi:MAG: methionyl-tRNA formyltransferase [Vicinamibacterales bacterium]